MNPDRKINFDTSNNARILYDYIMENDLSGEEVFNMFINWHGNQLCTPAFMENLRDVEGNDGLPESE